jgi:transcriptional regulator with XRE-family HTH domain
MVQTALGEFCASKGTAKAAAKEMGISPQYLSDLLRGRRDIPDRIAEFLGFRKTITYSRSRLDSSQEYTEARA